MSLADREKWDARYRTQGAESSTPSRFLAALAELPLRGRALDVAGGAGPNAVWLARRGLDVTLVDISSEALVLASAAAAQAGVSLSLVAADLEEDALPQGPFDLVISFNFLRRELFPLFPVALAPGGLLVYLQPTRSNLQRHPRPPAPFLLEDGELPTLVPGLEILRYEEGWSRDGDEPRHEARLVARKPQRAP
jgi:SAM-dependent methyltransferase